MGRSPPADAGEHVQERSERSPEAFRPSPGTNGPRKIQAVCSASIVAVGTIPSTRRASSVSRVTNASACS
jgi:hypothetical protein